MYYGVKIPIQYFFKSTQEDSTFATNSSGDYATIISYERKINLVNTGLTLPLIYSRKLYRKIHFIGGLEPSIIFSFGINTNPFNKTTINENGKIGSLTTKIKTDHFQYEVQLNTNIGISYKIN